MRTLLFALAAVVSFGEDRLRTLPADAIQSRFAKVNTNNVERANELRRMFADAGCKDYTDSPVQGSKAPNLICVLPGTTKRTVVVTAHHDNRGPGEGALDNWSGAALLPSLFESLNGFDRNFTFEFIAFTDEERGLIGSRDYVGHLSKEHRAEIAMNVNIDCVGLAGPIRVWTGKAADSLVNAAALVADEMKISIGGATLDRRYDSDASAFWDWRIPVIDFHSLTSDTLSLLHSKKDVRSAIDAKSYYDHYRFLAAYLARLDATMGASSTSRAPAR